MRTKAAGILFAPFVSLAIAQTALAPEMLLLARIKVRAEETLARLPNCTCLETIERSHRRASGKFQLVDVLRMEVAFVDRKELYSWPGSQQFEDRDLFEMVGGGTISNGGFALHARSVFLGNGAVFTYVGERIREGRRAIRYDYRVPVVQSGYRLRVRSSEGIAGYHGSFWVDAEAFDLIRLEVIAEEIPPHLPVIAATETLQYSRVKIGDGDFLLPFSSELVMTDLAGNENRNRTRFTSCRQFAGDSVISFEDAPASAPLEQRVMPKITLDEGLEIDMKLESAIEPGVSAVGDAIRAVTSRNIVKKGIVVVPKGAAVTGRIVRMRRNEWRGDVYWLVGLDLTRIEFAGQFADLRVRLMPHSPGTDFTAGSPPGRSTIISRHVIEEDPRIGMLYIRGDKGRIPNGFPMYWRTQIPPERGKP